MHSSVRWVASFLLPPKHSVNYWLLVIPLHIIQSSIVKGIDNWCLSNGHWDRMEWRHSCTVHWKQIFKVFLFFLTGLKWCSMFLLLSEGKDWSSTLMQRRKNVRWLRCLSTIWWLLKCPAMSHSHLFLLHYVTVLVSLAGLGSDVPLCHPFLYLLPLYFRHVNWVDAFVCFCAHRGLCSLALPTSWQELIKLIRLEQSKG